MTSVSLDIPKDSLNSNLLECFDLFTKANLVDGLYIIIRFNGKKSFYFYISFSTVTVRSAKRKPGQLIGLFFGMYRIYLLFT